MTPYLSDKTKNKINFYRTILFLMAAAYLIFYFLFEFTLETGDPLSIWERILPVILFTTVLVSSYFNSYIRKKIEFISLSLAAFSLMQLLYYNFYFQFRIELAVLFAMTAAFFNLIFTLYKVKLVVNIFLFLGLGLSLYLLPNSNINKAVYLNSYFLISALSYYISYFFEKYQSKLAKNLKEKRNVLNTIETQIWYLKDPQTYGIANQAHADFLGLSVEKIENSNIYELLSEKEAKNCFSSNEKVFITKEKIKTEEWAKNAEGKKRLLSITKSPNFNSEGELEYVVCSAEDITEKFNVNQKIKTQKNRLEWILDAADAGVYEWDIEQGKTIFNNKLAELLGYDISEIEPINFKKWQELIHPDDFQKSQKLLEKHFTSDKSFYETEIRMKHKDGHWVWIADRGRVVSRSKTGKPLKMNGIHLDISERKERERKFRESKELLENLTDQVPGTIYQFKSKAEGGYCFPYASKGLYDLYELHPEELKNDAAKFYSRIYYKDLKSFSDSVEESKMNMTTWHNIFRVDLPKKGIRWIEGNSEPEKLDDGQVLWHGYIRDITARRMQEKELEEQHKFQKNLAEISSKLLDVDSENINVKLNNALKTIGEYFEIDRSYIFRINKENLIMSNEYEWTADHISSKINERQNLNLNDFEWWHEQLKKKKIIIVKDVNNLPEEAALEKRKLQARNIKSLVGVPIVIDHELRGYFGFDFVTKAFNLSEIKLNQLNIFADVIKGAISKYLDTIKIKELSYYDSLTGLYNRRFFDIELERLDTKRQLPISIIMADVNGLKIINDSYGHQKGDQLLKKSAEILKSTLREEDILARQGGDEFIILLPQTSEKEVEQIMQRIKSETGKRDDFDIPISIALGQSVKTEESQSLEKIMVKADNQMYKNKLSESRSSKSSIVQGLINTLDAKSSETKEHALRMTKLAFDFGEKLGLSTAELNRLSLLATLHDVGKINVSEDILNKPGKLNDKEWEVMKKHTEQGYKIASASEEFALVADEIFSHHEHWDGSGYPRHLSEDDIPYLARIIALIDAYDVMTNERPYGKVLTKEEAIEEIRRCSGTQFDPKLAVKFIELLEDNSIYSD